MTVFLPDVYCASHARGIDGRLNGNAHRTLKTDYERHCPRRRAVEKVVSVYDFYTTVLHLLGLNHERLTYYHNGTNRRLTDVHGHVIREWLA